MPCRLCGLDGHNRQTCEIKNDLFILAEVEDYNEWRDLSQADRLAYLRGEYEATTWNELTKRLSSDSIKNYFRHQEHINQHNTMLRQRELRDALIEIRNRDTDQIEEENKKSPMPKHITKIVYESGEEITCAVCLDNPKQEDFIISQCGHYYCQNCYNDSRLDKCATCREDNF